MVQTPLKVFFDSAQPRVRYPSVTTALRGAELFDQAKSSGTTLCPATNAVILRPYATEEAWFTSNAGNYAKPALAAYEFGTPSKWREQVIYTGAGSYVSCDSPSGDYVRTVTAPGRNRGIALSFFNFGAGDRFVAMEAGWHNTNTTAETATIGIKFFSTGEIEIWRGGALEGTYNGVFSANTGVHLILLPSRKRELLIWNTWTREGFVHVFEHIAETASLPEITPAEKFFVSSAITNALRVQIAPLTFPTSGTVVSGTYQFGRPPKATQTPFTDWINPLSDITNASIYCDLSGNTGSFASDAAQVTVFDLRDGTNSADFVADGELTAARTRVTLTGNGSYTPFLYGVVYEFDRTVENTNDSEEVDVTGFISAISLDVPDDPLGTKMAITVRRDTPEIVDGVLETRLLDDLIPNITTQSYRPFRVEMGDVRLFDGYLVAPRFQDGPTGVLQEITFEGQALESLLEKHVFRSRVPLDGLPLCKPSTETSAVSYVLRACGWPVERMVLDDLDFTLSEVPDEDLTEWNVAIEVGMSGREALDMLHEFAKDSIYGTRPGVSGIEFFWTAPENIETEPRITLYRTVPEAMEAEPSLTESEAARLVYSNYADDVSPLEANEVIATGVDPRTQNIFMSFAVDEESADPTLAPSMRPANWSGIPLPVGVASRRFAAQKDTDQFVGKLLPVATAQDVNAECDANTLLLFEDGVWLPLWRGHAIEIKDVIVAPVSSLRCDFIKEYDAEPRAGTFVWRQAHYTFGRLLGLGGTTLAMIQTAQEIRNVDRLWDDLQRNPRKIGTGIFTVSKVTGP